MIRGGGSCSEDMHQWSWLHKSTLTFLRWKCVYIAPLLVSIAVSKTITNNCCTSYQPKKQNSRKQYNVMQCNVGILKVRAEARSLNTANPIKLQVEAHGSSTTDFARSLDTVQVSPSRLEPAGTLCWKYEVEAL